MDEKLRTNLKPIICRGCSLLGKVACVDDCPKIDLVASMLEQAFRDTGWIEPQQPADSSTSSLQDSSLTIKGELVAYPGNMDNLVAKKLAASTEQKCQMTIDSIQNSQSLLPQTVYCSRPAKYRLPQPKMGVEFVCGIHARPLDAMFKRMGSNQRCLKLKEQKL